MTTPRPTIRHWLEFLGLSLAVGIVKFLPWRMMNRLAQPLGNLVCACDRRGRAVAHANLDAAFGTLSLAEKNRITRASYRGFARTMLELLWSPNLTPAVFEKIVSVEGPGTTLKPSQSAIYICLHASNFEWFSQRVPLLRGYPGIVVTQRMKNPLLGAIFDRLRGSSGHEIIPQERALIRMLRHLKNGGYFCMVMDLNLDPDEASVIIEEFGGLKTCVTQMHAALALHTGAKIIPCEGEAMNDGTYRLIFHEPLDYPADATAAEIAQLCWDVLEPSIRTHPEQWLWSYKHWRFQPADKTGARYPFYANEAKRFDRLLQK